VNSKLLQVVVGVRKGDDFSLAAVARSGINLPDVQRLPETKAKSLSNLGVYAPTKMSERDAVCDSVLDVKYKNGQRIFGSTLSRH